MAVLHANCSWNAFAFSEINISEYLLCLLSNDIESFMFAVLVCLKMNNKNCGL